MLTTPHRAKRRAISRITRLSAVLWSLVWSVNSSPTLASEGEHPLPENFEVTELVPNEVLVVTTQPFSANSLLIRGASGIVLVDSPTTPADTARLLDWIEFRWKSPVTHGLTSHWHADASAGNQVLVARGAEVISSRSTAERLLEEGESMRTQLIEYLGGRNPEAARELASFEPTPPTRTIDIEERHTLQVAGETVVLIDAGPSHSEDSIGIYFPRWQLLYGGCTVRSDGKIVNREGANFENWPRVLDAFSNEKPRRVVPGHGRRFEPAMLEESKAAALAVGTELAESTAAGQL